MEVDARSYLQPPCVPCVRDNSAHWDEKMNSLPVMISARVSQVYTQTHIFVFLQMHLWVYDYLLHSVHSCGCLQAVWAVCVYIHVFSGIQHPKWPSIERSANLTPLCGHNLSVLGLWFLCGPMYSSCSCTLPLHPLSLSLSFFLFPTLFCSLWSPIAARHTYTHSPRRYTSNRAFMRTFKYMHMHYSFTCTQGYMTDTVWHKYLSELVSGLNTRTAKLVVKCYRRHNAFCTVASVPN